MIYFQMLIVSKTGVQYILVLTEMKGGEKTYVQRGKTRREYNRI